MRPVEIGIALNSWRSHADPAPLSWREIRDLATRSEEVGFDTVWVPDGLLGRLSADGPVLGQWDAIALLSAIAASTSRARVGSWVLASLYRSPALAAKQAATIDEISGGRFVLGIGAGDASWATRGFGLPDDHVYERFEDALAILVPLLRAGRADHAGPYWTARDLVQLPAGPRPGAIPILIAAHGPKGYRHAARLADVWSCVAAGTGDSAEFGARARAFESACTEAGRDPGVIGRSAGLAVGPLAGDPASVQTPYGRTLTGSADQIAEALLAIRDVGFTRLELMVEPLTPRAIEALAPVVERLHAA